MKLLPFLYLNRWDNQLAPNSKIARQVESQQWTIVTAPRPLPGAVHWVGGINGFPTGSYAAGPWSQYAEQWRSLDARQVVLTNNRTIIRKLEEAHAQPIDTLLAQCDEGYGIAQLAAELDPPLPWLDPPLVDSGKLLDFLYASLPDLLNLSVYSEHKWRWLTYDFTPYALTKRQRVEEAVQTLVSQGYAVTDGETVRLSESAQTQTSHPHPNQPPG